MLREGSNIDLRCFLLFFSTYIFFSQLHGHPREDNHELYYWAEMMGQYTHKHLTFGV